MSVMPSTRGWGPQDPNTPRFGHQSIDEVNTQLKRGCGEARQHNTFLVAIILQHGLVLSKSDLIAPQLRVAPTSCWLAGLPPLLPCFSRFVILRVEVISGKMLGLVGQLGVWEAYGRAHAKEPNQRLRKENRLPTQMGPNGCFLHFLLGFNSLYILLLIVLFRHGSFLSDHTCFYLFPNDTM